MARKKQPAMGSAEARAKAKRKPPSKAGKARASRGSSAAVTKAAKAAKALAEIQKVPCLL